MWTEWTVVDKSGQEPARRGHRPGDRGAPLHRAVSPNGGRVAAWRA